MIVFVDQFDGEGALAMSYPIEKIEGIGKVYGAKLRGCGLENTAALLKACAKPKDRETLAAKSGIPPKLILEFANRADLMRVKGVGEEYSDLLEVAGVDTVPELAQRNAANLFAALEAAAKARNLVRRLPTLVAVEGWIESARTLPRALQY